MDSPPQGSTRPSRSVHSPTVWRTRPYGPRTTHGTRPASPPARKTHPRTASQANATDPAQPVGRSQRSRFPPRSPRDVRASGAARATARSPLLARRSPPAPRPVASATRPDHPTQTPDSPTHDHRSPGHTTQANIRAGVRCTYRLAEAEVRSLDEPVQGGPRAFTGGTDVVSAAGIVDPRRGLESVFRSTDHRRLIADETDTQQCVLRR